MGHFNNFTIDDGGESPFILNYSFEFVMSSLSNDYNEINGHFTPIKKDATNSEIRTLEDLRKTDPVLSSVDQFLNSVG